MAKATVEVEPIPREVKAALVMLILGEEKAAPVFKRLEKDEVKALNKGMTMLAGLTDEEQHDILVEYIELVEKGDPMKLEGGEAYLKRLVEANMGGEGRKLIEEIASEHQMQLNALEPVDPRTLANLLRKEHPQTIALIMAYSKPEKSAQVLSQLPVETQVEVCLRMASLDTVAPQTLRDVENALLSEMKGLVVSGGEETSGVVMVAEILNNIEKQHEERIFEQLMEIDPELAEEIRNNMFVFADLVNIDDRGIQTLLKEVDNQSLLLALKTAPDVIKEKIFKNLSSRATQMLKEDMEVMPPVKLSEVEKAQASITQLALRLEAEGKIVIAKAGAAEEFV
jgi:flagellar motor switch protein FliG